MVLFCDKTVQFVVILTSLKIEGRDGNEASYSSNQP